MNIRQACTIDKEFILFKLQLSKNIISQPKLLSERKEMKRKKIVLTKRQCITSEKEKWLDCRESNGSWIDINYVRGEINKCRVQGYY